MSQKSQMPKIKYSGTEPKLDNLQIDFMKLVEKQNLERVQKLRTVRRKNLLTAGILFSTVIGIYSYSILSIRQETFLDDFDAPKKITN